MKQTQLSFDVFSHTCLLFHTQHFQHLSSYLLQDFWSQGLLPEIPADHLPLIARASSLHDIGKCVLSEQIVHGTTKLSPLEYEIMKQHTTLGAMILEQALSESFDPQFRAYAVEIALYHHERWDGRGYPAGLNGAEIPGYVQVIGMADAYDALRASRSYRPALPHQTAVDMMVSGKCGIFAPQMLAQFVAAIDTADEAFYGEENA